MPWFRKYETGKTLWKLVESGWWGGDKSKTEAGDFIDFLVFTPDLREQSH